MNREIKYKVFHNGKMYQSDEFDETWVIQMNGTLGKFNGSTYDTVTDAKILLSTGLKDKNGVDIYFGDKLRFSDKIEWYKTRYSAKIAMGTMTKKEALDEIEKLPYEERLVGDVQDYHWLLSYEIQTYWEVF